MVRTRSADRQKKRAKPRSNTNVATNVRDATESQEPPVQPMDVPADVPVAPTVTNMSALLVGDSMKQQEGESILEFSLRTIGSVRDRTITEEAKMELFKKNLLPHLAHELEVEDQRKKFKTLTGMACYLEQRIPALANPANRLSEATRAIDENSTVNETLVNAILSENDHLRHSLIQDQGSKDRTAWHRLCCAPDWVWCGAR